MDIMKCRTCGFVLDGMTRTFHRCKDDNGTQSIVINLRNVNISRVVVWILLIAIGIVTFMKFAPMLGS